MLFPYQYVPHQMERMQEFIDYIFFEVWCKAPIGLVFHLDLFEEEPDLKEVLSSFGFAAKAPKRGKQFYKDIKEIYDLFAALTPSQIDKFKQWYQANNDIEKVCANDPAAPIARYADIQRIHSDLSQQLASFFKDLYSQDLLNLAALRKKIGQIDDHYHEFMNANKGGKCPFCGVADIKGINHSKREAYDHYLPKAIYPFNSINFRNLSPVCHECNSSYKLSKDPVRNAVGRRKTFYPYATTSQPIEIGIALGTSDVDRLTPADIQLTFGPSAISEEIETWKDVYGIEERYKAKCCSCDAKVWLEDMRISCDMGSEPEKELAKVRQISKKFPFADNYFLKVAFLEGCQRIGMWNSSS